VRSKSEFVSRPAALRFEYDKRHRGLRYLGVAINMLDVLYADPSKTRVRATGG
jgi:hypothetical protein